MLVCFIISILLIYQKKQIIYNNKLEEVKINFEKALLATHLEIREDTFQNISREIHDNISLSLTLAKLHLNTIDWNDKDSTVDKINSSIELLGKSIHDLSDISKGLNPDVIIQQGLIKALEYEVERINKIGLFKMEFRVEGTSRFMDAKMELIIFRIIQEAFNNIIKHAKATAATLELIYSHNSLSIAMTDDGVGFKTKGLNVSRRAGLTNMALRTKMLNGEMLIHTIPNTGTKLNFNIPFY